MKIEFICLADSFKKGGHCIAGKRTDTLQWIRPVSQIVEEGLSDMQICYEDGSCPNLLDIIEIEAIQSVPCNHQTENWLFDETIKWKKVGVFTGDLDSLVDTNISLLSVTSDSSKKKNCRIDTMFSITGQITNSLLFLKIPKATVSVIKKYDDPDNYDKDTILKFTINNKQFEISKKDRRNIYSRFGNYPIENPLYITLSLALDFNGYCYLLVAGIL